jgi:hypothetical protein
MHDGAPAGEYRVVVEWPAYRRGRNIGPDRLMGKFAKPETSGLKATIEPGPNGLPPFELKAALSGVQSAEPARVVGGARRDR